jgi:hypothetical protein
MNPSTPTLKYKITSADALFHCAQHGKSLICPSVSYLEEPTKAKSFLNLSMKAVFKCIENGLYLVDDGIEYSLHPQIQEQDQHVQAEVNPQAPSILEYVQNRMKTSGESQSIMAKKAGVTQQRVSEFLFKKGLRSHLERFARIYAPEIYDNIQEHTS